MRSLLTLVVLGLAAVVCLVVLSPGDGRGSGASGDAGAAGGNRGPGPDGRGPEAGDPGVLDVAATTERAPVAVGQPPPEEAPEGAPEPTPAVDPDRPTSTLNLELYAYFEDCLARKLEGEELRECLQGQIGGRDIPPLELAGLVCGEVPPDGADRVFIQEVASLWPPEDSPRRILAFQGACNEPGGVWAELMQRQAERDPAWLEAFVESVGPELVFDGDGLTMLAIARSLTELGDDGMRRMLELGATGALGGSDRQVAFALTLALDGLADGADARAFLRSIATSDAFEGRPSEVHALASCLFGRPGTADGSEEWRALVEEVFAQPHLAPGLAKYVLDHESWRRLPEWLSADDRARLVELARDAAY